MATVPLGRGFEDSVRVRPDANPQIRAAGFGIVGVRQRENADFCIRPEAHLAPEEPKTPPHLQKFRKTHTNEPGKIQKHWGQANDDPKFPPTYSYGKSTYASEHVSDVVKA